MSRCLREPRWFRSCPADLKRLSQAWHHSSSRSSSRSRSRASISAAASPSSGRSPKRSASYAATRRRRASRSSASRALASAAARSRRSASSSLCRFTRGSRRCTKLARLRTCSLNSARALRQAFRFSSSIIRRAFREDPPEGFHTSAQLKSRSEAKEPHQL